jgi:hypothetical protein
MESRTAETSAVVRDGRDWLAGYSRRGARPSHMVLELGLGVERLGGRRGDDWRRGRGASGKTGENEARDNDAQNLGHEFS